MTKTAKEIHDEVDEALLQLAPRAIACIGLALVSPEAVDANTLRAAMDVLNRVKGRPVEQEKPSADVANITALLKEIKDARHV